MKKFVIVSTQRSGTGLLRTTLDNHPDVLCLGETFKIKYPRPFLHDLSYSNYLKNSLYRKFRHYTNRSSVTYEYLDWLYSHSRFKAVGFKLMYSQLSGFSSAHEYAIHNKLKYIHVVRQNSLASLVSRYVVRQTGIPHSEKKIVVEPVYIPTDDLIKKLERIDRENQYWADQMQRTMDYITIYYEDMVDDIDATMKEIFTFIGIENIVVKTSLQKISSTQLSESIANYEEVSEFLQKTVFQHFLEDVS